VRRAPQVDASIFCPTTCSTRARSFWLRWGRPADGTCSDTKGQTPLDALRQHGEASHLKTRARAVLAARNAGIPVVEKRARTSLAELASEFLEVFGNVGERKTRAENGPRRLAATPERSPRLAKFVAEEPNSAIFDVGSETSLVFAIVSSEKAM